jgi:glycerol-3-phosphate acyltransferase PlsY
MDIVALYIGAYLLGSIPTAYLIGRLVKGVDIRGYGSGNVGSANLYEHVGKRWVYPVAVVEIFVKGTAPIWFALFVLDIDRSSAYMIGPPLLTLAGNNWSVFLKLQGGRGIAVAGGTLLALTPLLAVGCAVISIGGWKLTKSSGLWVLISLTLLPVWAYLLHDNLNLVWYTFGILGLVVLKRLSSNWTPFPEDVSRKKVLFNRLLQDRDVSDRTDWVRRIPEGSLGIK